MTLRYLSRFDDKGWRMCFVWVEKELTGDIGDVDKHSSLGLDGEGWSRFCVVEQEVSFNKYFRWRGLHQVATCFVIVGTSW